MKHLWQWINDQFVWVWLTHSAPLTNMLYGILHRLHYMLIWNPWEREVLVIKKRLVWLQHTSEHGSSPWSQCLCISISVAQIGCEISKLCLLFISLSAKKQIKVEPNSSQHPEERGRNFLWLFSYLALRAFWTHDTFAGWHFGKLSLSSIIDLRMKPRWCVRAGRGESGWKSSWASCLEVTLGWEPDQTIWSADGEHAGRKIYPRRGVCTVHGLVVFCKAAAEHQESSASYSQWDWFSLYVWSRHWLYAS